MSLLVLLEISLIKAAFYYIYWHSLAELRIGSKRSTGEFLISNANASEVSITRPLVREMQDSTGHAYEDYELPRMPPWFAYVGSHKLYQALAQILRLVGLSLVSGIVSAQNSSFLWWILMILSVS